MNTALQLPQLGKAIARFSLCLISLVAAAQDFQTNPIVMSDTGHATSAPVRDMAESAFPPAHTRMIKFLGRRQEQPVSGPAVDPVAQEPAGPLVSTTNMLNFDGQAESGFIPPDTNGAVGFNQFVQVVNDSFAIFDKTTGTLLKGPLDLQALWANLPGLCATGDESDPVVLYDKAANRWVFSKIAFNNDLSSNSVCIAVSSTADATGIYHVYSRDFGGDFPDYPKIATWPDAYYLAVNIFTSGGTLFKGAEVCAFDRSAMLAGNPLNVQCFQRASGDFSYLPSDLDSRRLPPAGSPNYFLELLPSNLLLFAFHVDFTNPANSTFSRVGVVSGVAPFTKACGGGICIPEPAPGELLDSLADRLMFRLSYRNFGGHETLLVNHSVRPGTGPAAGVRWYEIRSPGSAPFVFQQGTVAGPLTSFWMGSIAMDKLGDIALGFSASSTSMDPSIFYTGRVPADPLGTMEMLQLIERGTGVQTHGMHRWGDYSSMSIDPIDECTFWYTQEYYKTTGAGWNTRIASFKFSSCN